MEHTYTYFKRNINILKESAHIQYTFVYISNEILTFWISWNTLNIFQMKYLHFEKIYIPNTIADISNEILTCYIISLFFFQMKY